MRASSDPSRRLRRGAAAVWLAGGPVVALCAAWAFWPAQRPPLVARNAPPQSAVGPAEAPAGAIDPGGFKVALWNPVPAPAELPRQTRPAPSLVLELVAIIDEAGGRKAALYDRQAGTLLVVASGQPVGAFTVTAIEPGSVEIADGGRTVRLLLEEESP